MMKTLLIGCGGSFSLFTQSTVVRMDEEGLHEMITKDTMRLSKAPDNFVLFIVEILSSVFATATGDSVHKILNIDSSVKVYR